MKHFKVRLVWSKDDVGMVYVLTIDREGKT